jgi:hypothetical protein
MAAIMGIITRRTTSTTIILIILLLDILRFGGGWAESWD